MDRKRKRKNVWHLDSFTTVELVDENDQDVTKWNQTRNLTSVYCVFLTSKCKENHFTWNYSNSVSLKTGYYKKAESFEVSLSISLRLFHFTELYSNLLSFLGQIPNCSFTYQISSEWETKIMVGTRSRRSTKTSTEVRTQRRPRRRVGESSRRKQNTLKKKKKKKGE